MGQLGVFPITPNEFYTPVSIISEGIEFVQIDGGWQHTCALDGAGQVWCWGLDYNGQLGDGIRSNGSTPALVAGLYVVDALLADGFE